MIEPQPRPHRINATLGFLRRCGWGLVTLAAFAWHFRYLETHMRYWGQPEPSVWRIYEALALIPLAVAVNWLFWRRQLVALGVLVGFWLTLAGPFDVKLLELNAPLLPSDVTLTLRQFANLKLIEQAALSAWMGLGLLVTATILHGLWRAGTRTRLLLVGASLLTPIALAVLGYVTLVTKWTNTHPRIQSTRYGHLTFYAAHAERRFFERMPSREETIAAHQALMANPLLQAPIQPAQVGAAASTAKDRPSLYVILAESWIDPLDLGFTLSEDPFPPRLRAWMRQSRSRLLVSTSRGGTASTEFELLYGMPAQLFMSGYGIEFRQYLRQPVPGLAAQLRQATVACDLQSASAFDFYAEHNGYRCAGFEDIRLGSEFDRSEQNLDGSLLSDGSFFDQAMTRLQTHPPSPQPALHWLITMAGHYAFPLNQTERPRFITGMPRSEGVETLVNRVAYSSRAFVAVIDQIRRVDPDASIVVFGDHTPQPNDEMAATPYYRNPETAYSTPLLWLDKGNTPRPLGRIPAYGLHYRILQHFGVRPQPWAEPFARAARMGLRNYPDIGRYAYQGDPAGPTHWCPNPLAGTNACAQGSDFFKQARVIALDVLSGSQHSLRTSQHVP